MNSNKMREILFRGKRDDNGEWVEGDFCRPCNICFEEIGEDVVLGQSGVPIWADHSVIPKTVGQFTGLFDKNGKRIYEGDVCRFCCDERESPSDYLVRWIPERCSFATVFIRCGELCDTPDELDEFFAQYSEVIANIHDSPELLGGVENG